MVIKRDKYVNELLSKRWNGKVKIITGIRRCGKSFLLSTLYKDYLKDEGVPEDCFVEIALDRKAYVKYRNPNELYDYVLSLTRDESKRYYVFIDEIQLSFKVKNEDVVEELVPDEDKDMLYTTFYDILNDLMARSNLDVYVTGSNSKMLSKDIVTNFRDRGTEIKVYPLSFKEFYDEMPSKIASETVSDLKDGLDDFLQYNTTKASRLVEKFQIDKYGSFSGQLTRRIPFNSKEEFYKGFGLDEDSLKQFSVIVDA